MMSARDLLADYGLDAASGIDRFERYIRRYNNYF
jgi:hypothetical protein